MLGGGSHGCSLPGGRPPRAHPKNPTSRKKPPGSPSPRSPRHLRHLPATCGAQRLQKRGRTPPRVGNRWPLLPPAGPAHGQDVVGVGAGGHGAVEVAEVLGQQLAQGAAAHQAGCGCLLGQPRQQEQVFPSLQRHPARLRGRGGGRGGGRSPAVSISPPLACPRPPYLAFAQPHQGGDQVAVPPRRGMLRTLSGGGAGLLLSLPPVQDALTLERKRMEARSFLLKHQTPPGKEGGGLRTSRM